MDIRILKGDPTPEELAALTAVLMALAALPQEAPSEVPRPARWQRHERRLAFAPPISWQQAA